MISGSYQQGISFGLTTNPTVTVHYARVGNIVTLFFPTFTGVSNSTAFLGSGDMPENIRPTSQRACGGIRVVDNGNFELGSVVINNLGQLTFYRGAQTSWTDSGTKGWMDSSFTYCI